MTFVLVFLIMTGGANSAVTGTAEFNTEQACKDAGFDLLSRTQVYPEGFANYEPFAVCFSKGDKKEEQI